MTKRPTKTSCVKFLYLREQNRVAMFEMKAGSNASRKRKPIPPWFGIGEDEGRRPPVFIISTGEFTGGEFTSKRNSTERFFVNYRGQLPFTDLSCAMTTRNSDTDEWGKTDRLLKKSTGAESKPSAMYRIGFRQFNSHGSISAASDQITHHRSGLDSGRRRGDDLTQLSNNETTISPTKWYLTLQNDAVDEYDSIMTSFPDCKLNLIQGRFTYQADMHLAKLARELKAHCVFETSFILACAFGSKGIVQKMLDDGVDVRVRERSGVNFVHALIQAVAESRERETMLVEMYKLVMDHVRAPIRRELLTVEDKDCYRPVELAVRRGAYGMFKAIFETVGAYRNSEPAGRMGLHTFQSYDISEYENYESRCRELRSPLRLMNFMGAKHLNSYLKFDVHSVPAIKRWREQKIRGAMPIVAVWYFLKLLFVTAVIFLDSSRMSFRRAQNATVSHALSTGDPALDDSLILVMVITGGLIVLVALILNVKQLLDRERRRVDGHVKHKEYLVHTSFFTYVQVIMCSLVIVQFIMSYSGVKVETIYGVKAVLIPFGLLSYLQIFLVVPYIDRFVIALQRMVVVLMKFVAISITVRLVFCLFLMTTEHQHPSSNFNNLNDAFYGIFLLDLSIIQLEPPFYLQFTHVAFYYISGVLLINYLIAVMSDMAAEVNQYGIIICEMTKLDLAFQAQENFGRYIWRCTGEPCSYLIVKIEDSKSIRQLELESAKHQDPEKYDIDN